MYFPITCRAIYFVLAFVGAQSLMAQNTTITYQCDFCEVVDILADLSEQEGLLFAYESELLRGKRGSVSFTNALIDDALFALLSPFQLKATVIGPGRYSITSLGTTSLRQSIETRTLSGIVFHQETGDLLPFATVRIGNSRGTRTTEDGMFFMALNAPFPDTLTVTYLGFRPLRIPIDYDNEMELGLEPMTTSIEDIIITDDTRQTLRVQDGGSTVQIDPQKLHLLSGLGEADLIRGLQLLPGLSAANERASGLYIRGGTPAENLILFDGITVYQPGHFFGLLSAFNADAIKDVKLYRSGTGARYGGRTGGVIDITGKPGRTVRPSISTSINLMNAQILAEVPWQEDKGGLLISARRSYTDFAPSAFFRQLFDNRFQEGLIYFGQQSQNQSENVLINPRLHYYDVNAKWLYRPNDRDLISVTAIKSGDELLYSLNEENQTGPDVASEDRLKLVNEGASMTFARLWNKSHYTRLNAAWSSYRNRYQYTYILAGDQFSYRSDLLRSQLLQDYAFRLEHSWTAPKSLRINGGIHRNVITLRDVQALDDTQTFVAEDVTLTDQGVTAAFVEVTDAGRIGGWELGLRTQLLDDSTHLFFEPRLMGFVRIGDYMRIQANLGRYHQYLNYVSVYNGLEAGEDFWALADGDSVSILRSDVASLSFSYDADDFLIQVEGYAKQQSGLMAYELQYNPNLNETDLGIRLSDGVGEVGGVEVMVQKKTGKYTGWVSYAYSRVLQRFPGNSETSLIPAAFDRPHQLSVVNQLTSGPLELSATWIFASGIPYTPAEQVNEIELPTGDVIYFLDFAARNSQRLPTYHRLDLSATYTVDFSQGSLRFGASVFNAYGRRNIGNRVYAVNRPENPGEEATVQVLDKPLLGFTPNVFLRWEL